MQHLWLGALSLTLAFQNSTPTPKSSSTATGATNSSDGPASRTKVNWCQTKDQADTRRFASPFLAFIAVTDRPAQTVDYAGVRRSIINRNPRLVDDDGYGVDSDDDDRVEDAISAAADQNPYSNIRLESACAPTHQRQRIANMTRHPRTIDRVDRSTLTSDPIETIHLAESDELGRAK